VRCRQAHHAARRIGAVKARIRPRYHLCTLDRSRRERPKVESRPPGRAALTPSTRISCSQSESAAHGSNAKSGPPIWPVLLHKRGPHQTQAHLPRSFWQSQVQWDRSTLVAARLVCARARVRCSGCGHHDRSRRTHSGSSTTVALDVVQTARSRSPRCNLAGSSSPRPPGRTAR